MTNIPQLPDEYVVPLKLVNTGNESQFNKLHQKVKNRCIASNVPFIAIHNVLDNTTYNDVPVNNGSYFIEWDCDVGNIILQDDKDIVLQKIKYVLEELFEYECGTYSALIGKIIVSDALNARYISATIAGILNMHIYSNPIYQINTSVQ